MKQTLQNKKHVYPNGSEKDFQTVPFYKEKSFRLKRLWKVSHRPRNRKLNPDKSLSPEHQKLGKAFKFKRRLPHLNSYHQRLTKAIEFKRGAFHKKSEASSASPRISKTPWTYREKRMTHKFKGGFLPLNLDKSVNPNKKGAIEKKKSGKAYRNLKNRRSFFNSKGQSLIEYLILVALMGVATIGIIRTLNQTVKSRFANSIYALQGRKQKAKTHNLRKEEYQRSDLSNFMSGAASTDKKQKSKR